MNKDLIFFHDLNHGYSKEMVNRMQQYNISNMFLLVDVSKGFKIPDFVDRIPLIYIRSSKEIVVDESIENLIDNIINTKLQNQPPSNMHTQQPQSQSQPQSQRHQNEMDDNILSAKDHFKGLSDTFSFIDEEGQLLEDTDSSMVSNRYLNLNMPCDDITASSGTGSGIKDEVKGPKFNEKQFDSYISQRDTDLASLFPNQQGTKPPTGFFER